MKTQQHSAKGVLPNSLTCLNIKYRHMPGNEHIANRIGPLYENPVLLTSAQVRWWYHKWGDVAIPNPWKTQPGCPSLMWKNTILSTPNQHPQPQLEAQCQSIGANFLKLSLSQGHHGDAATQLRLFSTWNSITAHLASGKQ